MKKVAKNSIKKIKNVLLSNHFKSYNLFNNYEGKNIGLLTLSEINVIIGDIQNGQATMYHDTANNKFVVKYAGRNKMESIEVVTK